MLHLGELGQGVEWRGEEVGLWPSRRRTVPRGALEPVRTPPDPQGGGTGQGGPENGQCRLRGAGHSQTSPETRTLVLNPRHIRGGARRAAGSSTLGVGLGMGGGVDGRLEFKEVMSKTGSVRRETPGLSRSFFKGQQEGIRLEATSSEGRGGSGQAWP